MKKRVCRICRMFTEEKICPICKQDQFATSWKGRIIILDIGKSVVAKRIEAKANGEYAMKV